MRRRGRPSMFGGYPQVAAVMLLLSAAFALYDLRAVVVVLVEYLIKR